MCSQLYTLIPQQTVGCYPRDICTLLLLLLLLPWFILISVWPIFSDCFYSSHSPRPSICLKVTFVDFHCAKREDSLRSQKVNNKLS
jgi:hypothetical protein